MVEKILTVRNRAGIHARPASLIAQTANKFSSEILLPTLFSAHSSSIVSCFANTSSTVNNASSERDFLKYALISSGVNPLCVSFIVKAPF